MKPWYQRARDKLIKAHLKRNVPLDSQLRKNCDAGMASVAEKVPDANDFSGYFRKCRT